MYMHCTYRCVPTKILNLKLSVVSEDEGGVISSVPSKIKKARTTVISNFLALVMLCNLQKHMTWFTALFNKNPECSSVVEGYDG